MLQPPEAMSRVFAVSRDSGRALVLNQTTICFICGIGRDRFEIFYFIFEIIFDFSGNNQKMMLGWDPGFQINIYINMILFCSLCL